MNSLDRSIATFGLFTNVLMLWLGIEIDEPIIVGVSGFSLIWCIYTVARR